MIVATRPIRPTCFGSARAVWRSWRVICSICCTSIRPRARRPRKVTGPSFKSTDAGLKRLPRHRLGFLGSSMPPAGTRTFCLKTPICWNASCGQRSQLICSTTLSADLTQRYQRRLSRPGSPRADGYSPSSTPGARVLPMPRPICGLSDPSTARSTGLRRVAMASSRRLPPNDARPPFD